MEKLHSESDAIKQAVEAGWKLRDGFPCIRIEELTTAHPNIRYWYRDNITPHEYAQDVESSEILQDPAFWSSLSKARGWEGKEGLHHFVKPSLMGGTGIVRGEIWCSEKIFHALRYFETLLAGKDTKEFWESLP